MLSDAMTMISASRIRHCELGVACDRVGVVCGGGGGRGWWHSRNGALNRSNDGQS